MKLKNKLPIIAKNKEILQAVALTSRSASMSDCSTTLEIIPDHEEQDIAENVIYFVGLLFLILQPLESVRFEKRAFEDMCFIIGCFHTDYDVPLSGPDNR